MQILSGLNELVMMLAFGFDFLEFDRVMMHGAGPFDVA